MYAIYIIYITYIQSVIEYLKIFVDQRSCPNSKDLDESYIFCKIWTLLAYAIN